MTAYKFQIGGKDYEVSVNNIEGTSASVSVNGVDYEVTLDKAVAPAPQAPAPAATAPATPAAPAPAAAPASGSKQITAPLPGVIIDVCVTPGQAVKAGQKVAVLEAMKMENEIQAESDGTVAQIFVKQGDSVLEGDPIVSLA